MTFEARYPGRCGNCPTPIDPGDTVTYDDDDVLVHTRCTTPDPDRLSRNETRCDTCNTIHAGECW